MGGLGPNYHIWAFDPKIRFGSYLDENLSYGSGLCLVGSVFISYFDFFPFSRVWAQITIFGHLGPKYVLVDILMKNYQLIVFEGSLKSLFSGISYERIIV